MPSISLPSQGTSPWDGQLNAAITTINNEVDDHEVRIEGLEAGGGGGGSTAWVDITGKPSTFPPTIGSGAADAVAGNDARLTNQRVPTPNSVDDSKVADSALSQSKISGLVSALAAKVAAVTTRTDALLAPFWKNTLRAAVASTDSNTGETWVGSKLISWFNEWGALRGTSPYNWGDALVRAIRENGDGITAGNSIESVDRRTGAPSSPNNVMHGWRWSDGATVRNGVVVQHVYTLEAGQTSGDVPAYLPVGTLIVRKTA